MSGADVWDAALFPGALAPFRSMLLCDPGPSVPTLGRPELLDALTRFQRSVDGAWQPACSLWAQLYFNTLLIPATCLLADDPDRIVRIAAVNATFCPVSGAPLRCALQTADPDRSKVLAGSRLASCLNHHMSAVIVDLNAVSRLSRGLLRESAERVLAWTLDEIGLAHPARARAAKTLLTEATCFSVRPSNRVAPSAIRRFCCLRDYLPNVPSCGETCPRANERMHLIGPIHQPQTEPNPHGPSRGAPTR